MNCQKRRVNDQYHCHQCGTQWDMDDQDPPVCQEECDHDWEDIGPGRQQRTYADCQKERDDRS